MRISVAQERVLSFLHGVRERDTKRGGKFAADPGWIPFWDIAQECGSTVPIGLLPNSFSKTITALETRGLIERDATYGELFRVPACACSSSDLDANATACRVHGKAG